jgi:hypothetical protein
MLIGNKHVEKTKPIYSFSVLSAACCVNEVEKTNPMLRWEI